MAVCKHIQEIVFFFFFLIRVIAISMSASQVLLVSKQIKSTKIQRIKQITFIVVNPWLLSKTPEDKLWSDQTIFTLL